MACSQPTAVGDCDATNRLIASRVPASTTPVSELVQTNFASRPIRLLFGSTNDFAHTFVVWCMPSSTNVPMRTRKGARRSGTARSVSHRDRDARDRDCPRARWQERRRTRRRYRLRQVVRAVEAHVYGPDFGLL